MRAAPARGRRRMHGTADASQILDSQMDTALGAGDLPMHASINTPEAKSDTGSKQVPIRESVTQDPALTLAASKAARVTTITSGLTDGGQSPGC